MQWTPPAAAHGLAAMGSLLDEGRLELLDAAGDLIGVLALGSPAFVLEGDGSAAAHVVSGDTAKRRGPIVGFLARAADGAVVIENGTVGLPGSGADLEMTRTGVRPGDTITAGTIRLET